MLNRAPSGETEWTITGQFTGRTDIPLTERGILQVQGTGETLVGSGNLLDPAKFAHVFVSPLQRARRTFELLLGDTQSKELVEQGKVTFTEDLLEWDYGEYDGFKSGEIRARRKEKGLDKERPWNQWVDGCEGGEYVSNLVKVFYQIEPVVINGERRFPEQVRQRVDRLIDQIREIQGPHIKGSLEGDVLVVSIGLEYEHEISSLAELTDAGRTRPHPACVYQTLAAVPFGFRDRVDDGARGGGCLELCPSFAFGTRYHDRNWFPALY